MADEIDDVSDDVAVDESAGDIEQQQSAPVQQAEPPIWDRFKSMPEFQGQDDRAIATRLYQTMQREQVLAKQMTQYQQILPHAQEYLSNQKEFQAWRNRPQTAAPSSQPSAPQAPAEAKGWWNPPEVRESYKRFLVKDESGRDVISQDAPLDAQHSLYEFLKYKSDFANKFLSDPAAALGPMVNELAQKQADGMIQARFDQQDQQSFVTNVERENRDWLYDSQTGNVSNAGLLVHKYIEEARERGINGPKPRWDYAIAMTERQLLAQSYDEAQTAHSSQAYQSAQELMRQSEAPAQPQVPQEQQPDLAAQNMQYLRREAARNPSRSSGAANNDPRASTPHQTFEQFLTSDARSKGYM